MDAGDGCFVVVAAIIVGVGAGEVAAEEGSSGFAVFAVLAVILDGLDGLFDEFEALATASANA